MSDERKERCENCRFWDESSQTDGHGIKHARPGERIDMGECRRYPPVVFTDEPMGYDQTERLPRTNGDDWCGEFQEKAILKPD